MRRRRGVRHRTDPGVGREPCADGRARRNLVRVRSMKRLGELRTQAADQLAVIAQRQRIAAASGNRNCFRMPTRSTRSSNNWLSRPTCSETKVRSTFVDGVSNAFADVVTGAKSASDAVRDFATATLREFARLAANKVATSLWQTITGIPGILGPVGAGEGSAATGYTLTRPTRRRRPSRRKRCLRLRRAPWRFPRPPDPPPPSPSARPSSFSSTSTRVAAHPMPMSPTLGGRPRTQRRSRSPNSSVVGDWCQHEDRHVADRSGDAAGLCGVQSPHPIARLGAADHGRREGGRSCSGRAGCIRRPSRPRTRRSRETRGVAQSARRARRPSSHVAPGASAEGTLRGSPLTVGTTAQHARQVTLAATNGKTLLMGDMIGVGGQLNQVSDDCVASGGQIIVPLVVPMRAQVAGGTAVVLSIARPRCSPCRTPVYRSRTHRASARRSRSTSSSASHERRDG